MSSLQLVLNFLFPKGNKKKKTNESKRIRSMKKKKKTNRKCKFRKGNQRRIRKK